MNYEETICAPATIPGTGAISVIRLSGPRTHEIIDKVISFKSGTAAQAKPFTVKYGTITDTDGSLLDTALTSIYKAPHSYTGEDSAEISCHASSYIAGRILALLTQAGARIAAPGEFTQRAFLNGKMDLAQAEAVADVIASESQTSHRVAMTQLKGGYSQELAQIRDALLQITSLLELELDFSEEDVEFADRTRLKALVESSLKKIRSLADSFRLGNALKTGVPVVIAGKPNVGKSTLLNALLNDDRAIVSDIAGTTRDSIEESVVIDGIRFRFIDTAGLRDSQDSIEIMGIERTRKLMRDASIVLAMVDASSSQEQLKAEMDELMSSVDFSAQKVVVLVNKIDYNKNVNAFNNLVSSLDSSVVVLEISAKTLFGLDELRSTLSSLVKDSISVTNDNILVTNARHHAALIAISESLTRVSEGLATSLPSDLIAQDLREALHYLGTITGEISTDEVLGEIFSRFCIGK